MSNQGELFNKRILVTGATSGIGKQIATTCAANGATVIFSGRSGEKLQALKESFGNDHLYIEADLDNDEYINKVAELCGPLNGIVHCAGILKTLPARFITRQTLQETINTNFFSSALLTTAILKKKAISRGGSIVFISSIGGNFIASKGNAMYSASKGAVNAYAKVLALELSSSQIRVNTLNPGMVKTEMWNLDSSSISLEQLAEDEKRYPLGYGEAIDIAEASTFLLSDKSKWITGSNIVLDGGFTIQ